MEKYSDMPISKLSEERDPKKEQHLLDRMNRGNHQAIVDAYHYARDIIKGRWPEAELYIKRHPQIAYYYIQAVIKGRWPEAEPALMKSPTFAYWYALHIIEGRWPEAEPYILKNPEKASAYAVNIIEGRWPEAEELFREDPEAWEEYVDALKAIGKDMDLWQVDSWE